MKPVQHALALSVVGLCGTAYAAPQIPYYASKFPQHPQNLGYAGDYPKYWQGEFFTSGNKQEPTRYGVHAEPEPALAPAPPRPDFRRTRYPVKEAMKYYTGGNFPTKSVAEAANDATPQPEPENTSSGSIKITNDTPFGAVNNDKSYTRITKSPSLGGPEVAPTIAREEVVEADDAGRSTASEEDGSDDLWNSFSFGVVTDTLNYHDPYEGREGAYKRKTNAISKIEKMMGKEYSPKEIAEASAASTPSNSRVHRRGLPHKPMTYQRPTTAEKREEEEEEGEGEGEEGKFPADCDCPRHHEPKYDEDHIRVFGYDIHGYDLSTLKLINAYEREARDAGKFRPFMFNPHIPSRLTMDTNGDWKPPVARQPRLTKRDWPEHIRVKAEKMMKNAKDMQEKGQLIIDKDPAYQSSLREKEGAREKEEATTQAVAEAEAVEEEENLFDLLPQIGKNKGASGAHRKVYPVGTTDDMASHRSQNTQPASSTAKVPKKPANPRQPARIVHKQLNQSNGNATAPRKNANSAPQNQQQPQQPRKKKRPMGNFPRKGWAKGWIKKNPLRKRDTTYAAGPEYPPGTTITRFRKCDSAGKCVTVAQPVAVAAPVVEAKPFVDQIDDGQPQLRHGVVPQPISPAVAPAPPPIVRIVKHVPAPSPVREVIIQHVPAPQAHPMAIVKAPAQPRFTVSYVPVVKPGQVLSSEQTAKEVEAVTQVAKAVPKLEKIQVEKDVQVERQVPVVKEVVKKPCGWCESSSCPCEYGTAPVATRPCGDPECEKGDIRECTCGAPGCNCSRGAGGTRGFPTAYSNGVKDVSGEEGSGCNTSGTGNGGHGHGDGHPRGHGTPSTPEELEAFWRKQVPDAFRSD